MAQNHPDRGQRGLPGGTPRYSAFALAKKAMNYHQDWQRAWRDPEPKSEYDAGTSPMLSHINVGSGTDVSILQLAQMVASRTLATSSCLSTSSAPPCFSASVESQASHALEDQGNRSVRTQRSGAALEWIWELYPTSWLRCVRAALPVSSGSVSSGRQSVFWPP